MGTDDKVVGVARHSWRTRDVWYISLSAFFADLGYQSVLAAFPIFLVIDLRRPVWEYGLAMALSYGGGAIFSLIGVKIGDRIGHRRLALIGNSLIPLLSLSALIANSTWAIGLLTAGWWARNLRSPSRRIMLNQAVSDERFRQRVFGFLHALDVGGAAAAAVIVLIAVGDEVPFRWLFLLTAVPLLVSTLSLSKATTGRVVVETSPDQDGKALTRARPRYSTGARAIFLATALYGFTFYSIGFPILTVAQKTHSISFGIVAFLVFQGFSAGTGFFVAKRLGKTLVRRFINLGVLGYLVSGLGALTIIGDIRYQMGILAYLVGMGILGFALGVIETLEPSLIAVISKSRSVSSGFGMLSASRSLGLLIGNLVMGLLYQLGPTWSYAYATIMAVMAAAIMLSASTTFARNGDDLAGGNQG